MHKLKQDEKRQRFQSQNKKTKQSSFEVSARAQVNKDNVDFDSRQCGKQSKRKDFQL